jgi:hypothetical protein
MKNKNFEFSHNLKWYIIRISFERVLRNIQKNLLLINFQNLWYTISNFPVKAHNWPTYCSNIGQYKLQTAKRRLQTADSVQCAE